MTAPGSQIRLAGRAPASLLAVAVATLAATSLFSAPVAAELEAETGAQRALDANRALAARTESVSRAATRDGVQRSITTALPTTADAMEAAESLLAASEAVFGSTEVDVALQREIAHHRAVLEVLMEHVAVLELAELEETLLAPEVGATLAEPAVLDAALTAIGEAATVVELANQAAPPHADLNVVSAALSQVSADLDRATTLATIPVVEAAPAPMTVAEVIADLAAQAQADAPRLAEQYANTTVGFANGRLPLDVLQPLSWQADQRLRADAATQLERLNAAFYAEFGRDLQVTSAYRSFAQQAQSRAIFGGWAAPPGQSNHGWGLAVDIQGGVGRFGSVEHEWMRANAPAFGWIHPTWAQRGGPLPEPWHWEFGDLSGQ